MADVKTDQEPSIEEILESIRQIISEDGAVTEKPEAAAKAAAPVAAPPKPAPPKAQVVEKRAEENILDLVEKVEPYQGPLQQSSPAVVEMRDTVMDNGDSLMSSETADAATDELSKILAGNVAVEREDVGRVGRVTLEDITRDLMKPIVKAWIDRNLPGIVEKAVQREVEKLSRRATDR